MVDVPDDQLDEEGKKEKRRQKLLKSNYDARMRMKAEKKVERARVVSGRRGAVSKNRRAQSVRYERPRRNAKMKSLERQIRKPGRRD